MIPTWAHVIVAFGIGVVVGILLESWRSSHTYNQRDLEEADRRANERHDRLNIK